MIWKWAQAERERRGWSQSELARRAGLSSQLISAGERGKKPKPSGETLAGLARAFGLTVDEMMRAAGSESYPRSPTLPELRELARGASPVAQQFLADLEEDYPVVSEATWHTLTQVFAALVAQDRAKQIHQRQQGMTEDAPADDPAEGMAHVSDGRWGPVALEGHRDGARRPRRLSGC